MTGQIYGIEGSIENNEKKYPKVEVSVRITVDHESIVTVDEIDDLSHEIARELDGLLKNVLDV